MVEKIDEGKAWRVGVKKMDLKSQSRRIYHWRGGNIEGKVWKNSKSKLHSITLPSCFKSFLSAITWRLCSKNAIREVVSLFFCYLVRVCIYEEDGAGTGLFICLNKAVLALFFHKKEARYLAFTLSLLWLMRTVTLLVLRNAFNVLFWSLKVLIVNGIQISWNFRTIMNVSIKNTPRRA